MIFSYLKLRWLSWGRLCREEFRIHPIVVAVVVLSAYVALLIALWRAEQKWQFNLTALIFGFTAFEKSTTKFLSPIMDRKKMRYLQTMENLIFIVPSLIVFLLTHQYLYAGASVGVFLVGMRIRDIQNLPIPLPLDTYNWEYLSTFRNPLVLAFLVLVLGIYSIALVVDNQHLSIFCVGILSLVVILADESCSKPLFYIWIYKGSARRLLYQKINNGIRAMMWLLPLYALNLCLYPSDYNIYIWMLLLCIGIRVVSIGVDYATYPSMLGKKVMFLLLASLLFICFVYPYLFPLAILVCLRLLHRAQKNIQSLFA